MMKLPSLAVCALMAPAITLGIGSALAAEPSAGPHHDAKEQRTAQEQRQAPEQSQKEKGMATADRAQEQRMAAERAKVHETYLSSVPANSFRADDLIGAKLKSRLDDEAIGAISDLVIDEHGQIAAVIVEVGGFLGLGKKDVAVSWDAIDRRPNAEGDGHDLSVDTSKDALKDAPEYQTEAD